MKITILGAGSMGTALASVIANNDNEINLWTIEQEVFEQVSNFHENKKYLPNVKLRSNIKITMSKEESLLESDIVIFSVPSHIVRIVAKEVAPYVPENAIIVDVAKGLEGKTNLRMSEVLEQELPNREIVCIGGPSIAKEVASKTPTFVVYASKNVRTALMIKDLFETNHYKINVSDDVIGVELCGTLKNIIAILAGISDGLGFGVNTKAGIITNGLKELSLIASRMGAKKETINGLAGLGDTIVTCMSPHSRNRQFGEKIAKGLNINQALSEVSQVVEGVNACRIAHDIIIKEGLNCPLISKVYGILFNNEEVSI